MTSVWFYLVPWVNCAKRHISNLQTLVRRKKKSKLFHMVHTYKVSITNLVLTMVIWVVKVSSGGYKIRKNQHTQRKLLNFENWCSGEVSNSAKIWLSKMVKDMYVTVCDDYVLHTTLRIFHDLLNYFLRNKPHSKTYLVHKLVLCIQLDQPPTIAHLLKLINLIFCKIVVKFTF